jgi:tRNA threonylcarbamoyl adenosine modification protein YeaZ
MTSCATSANPVLALNCAEERAQVVLGSDQGLLFSEEILCPGQSIRHLPTAIERALKVHGLSVKNLAGIACVRGPGSFTGLRISHAAMYGLARPFGTPMTGLPYLELLAAQATRLVDAEIWVLTYARKAQVYIQGFAGGRPLAEVRPMPASEVLDLLATRPGPLRLLGSGLRKNPDLCGLPGTTPLPPEFDVPRPEALLRAALNATYLSEPPAPLYLRKSDAEDNLEAIASSRGIAAEQARQHIPDFE